MKRDDYWVEQERLRIEREQIRNTEEMMRMARLENERAFQNNNKNPFPGGCGMPGGWNDM